MTQTLTRTGRVGLTLPTTFSLSQTEILKAVVRRVRLKNYFLYASSSRRVKFSKKWVCFLRGLEFVGEIFLKFCAIK